MAGKVLLVDDQPEVLQLLADLFAARNQETLCFQSGERALEALIEQAPVVDLAVLDLDLGPGRRDGLSILTEIKEHYPDLPVIILTGKGTVEDAVRATRLGATDFIEKDPRLGQRLDLQLVKLERILKVLQDNRRLRQQNVALRERAGQAAPMVGDSQALRQVQEKIRALADIPRPVLILGERGTGKELVAVALHQASRRRDGPFVTVNCATVPESLAEAELFGHEKGAYTDAREARPGRFELADGGTLFLDEVGNMPAPVQQKVLRAIEYQTFERVRGSQPVQVDVRVTAATNADLQAEMEAGRFRQDLYDRLAFDSIRVPPLRERREDIPALCRSFLQRFRKEVATLHCQEVSAEALAVLQALPFPGNVRELKNLVERAAYRCQTEAIGVADLDLPDRPAAPEAPTGSFDERVASFERMVLTTALQQCGHDLHRAAESLSLSYDQLRRLVKKHGLQKGGTPKP
jgi:DNA-binding NtrC family response regulator